MEGLSLRSRLLKRYAAMETERQSFISHWQDLSKFINPRSGRFLESDVNQGTRRNAEIINSKPTQALRIATAGMLAGVMSPARPWFKLETPDKEMLEFAPVTIWLEEVELRMREVFRQSNLYAMAPPLLRNLLLFGTAAMTHVDNFENVAHFFTHPVGSFVIGQDDNLKITTFARRYKATVEQMVSEFGKANCSAAVQNAYDRGNYDAWFDVVQFIMPNGDYLPNRGRAVNKKFRSISFEPGGSPQDEKVLKDSGFDEFPAYVPRWSLEGGDIYSTDCPGMTILGDVKGLQIMERRKAQAIDKLVNPPLKGPASLKNVPISSLPGGLNFYDDGGSGEGLKPLYEVKPQLGDLRLDMEAVERRIDTAMFVDLFLAITNMEGIQPRNELDLTKRDQERLLQLGPVLEQVHGEFLNPLIDRTFAQCFRAGILPPPPLELQGQPLKIEYISPLAQAQRAVSTSSIDRVAGFVGGLVTMGFTGALDKFDADQAIDEYGRAIGVPVRVIVPDEVVAERRQERQQMQQRQALLEQAQAASEVTANLGNTMPDQSGNSVLKQLSDASAAARR
jgi:hypothetical protein